MQCYSEILPPSGVTDSVALPFTDRDATNLVVARTSCLQIFEVFSSPAQQGASLSLLAEYHLEGSISALGRVKPLVSKSGGEALLIAFRNAKLSLVEWNPHQHSISTISIHYYENLDLSSCPWSPDTSHCLSHLTIDPSSRCAAFNFNVTSLAIVPFHQANDDLSVDDLDNLDMPQSNGDNAAGEVTGNGQSHATPYAPSFVLPMTALDPDLLHPIAIAFLYGYGDPTIGVLYTTAATSDNLNPIRKDVMIYAVYTLDLDQKASTTLLAVRKLPNDLHSIIAVPAPIGGAILIGGNNLLHVDQGGKVNALGVNEFAKECSSFPMADQSNLQFRLEGCRAIPLQNSANDMLLVLTNGSFVILSFRVDGRNVSGISLHGLTHNSSLTRFRNPCSTLAAIGRDHIFIGCEQADSTLLRVSHKAPLIKRQGSRVQLDGKDVQIESGDDDSLEEDEDDLYGDIPTDGSSSQQIGSTTVLFEFCDSVSCIGPIHDIAVGRPGKRKRDDEFTISDRLDLALACNCLDSGSLVLASKVVMPQILQTETSSEANSVWALSNQTYETESSDRPFDDILITSRRNAAGDVSSAVFSYTAGEFTELDAADFQENDLAIAAGRLATGSHVVVYSKEVRAYNNDFGLDQIFPIVDEESDPPATAKVVSASIIEQCILLLKDDATLTLLKADRSGDLDEVVFPDKFSSERVIAASLYDDNLDYFGAAKYRTGRDTGRSVILAILTDDGVFSLHTIFNTAIEVFRCQGLNFLPLQLSSDLLIPKHWRKHDNLVEILLCDLGTSLQQHPHLIIRSSVGDVTIYRPYNVPEVAGAYHFVKMSCHDADSREVEVQAKPSPSQLVAMKDLRGFAAVCITGQFPRIIVKTHETMPTMYTLGTKPIRGIAGFNHPTCNGGFAYVDEQGKLHLAELPAELRFAPSSWLLQRVPLECEVTSLAYYPRTQSYILATQSRAAFSLPRDDEWHPEWDIANEKASEGFLPTTTSSVLKLLSSESHTVISEYHFETDEQILDMKCLSLEVSEITHERKDMIVVGTGIIKGENVVTRGNIYIFDVVDVVPQPDVPETDLKLKLVTKEDVRGAVTALDGIGSQGFLLAAQGQKCMVRGLREDNAILPVAFLDMRFHVSVTKSLPGTGLTILGDAFSGLWLVGYSEEPYKMQVLGRDLENPAVVAAEFLPQDRQLYVISSDGNGELRVMQYDPENPQSERGTVLLQRSTFNTGHYPSRMVLLNTNPPSNESRATAEDSEDENDMELDETHMKPSKYQILIATQEGGLNLIVPLADQTYRRLNALQNILTTQLEQPCGLNPRAHRSVETDGLGGRGMIDGLIVRRWLDQSSQHKANLADRVGGSIWDVKEDLAAVLGGNINWF